MLLLSMTSPTVSRIFWLSYMNMRLTNIGTNSHNTRWAGQKIPGQITKSSGGGDERLSYRKWSLHFEHTDTQQCAQTFTSTVILTHPSVSKIEKLIYSSRLFIQDLNSLNFHRATYPYSTHNSTRLTELDASVSLGAKLEWQMCETSRKQRNNRHASCPSLIPSIFSLYYYSLLLNYTFHWLFFTQPPTHFVINKPGQE